jgi:ATP-dependent helicase IRC3
MPLCFLTHFLTYFCPRLCDVRFTSVKAQINLQDVTINSRNGDFNPTSLAHVVNTEAINELVVRSWIDRACGHPISLF